MLKQEGENKRGSDRHWKRCERMCGQWANEDGSKSAVLEKGERARRRAREACHSSVNEERSLWEPLSSNSPVGQPHTHFTCRKLTQIPIHARGTCSQFRRLAHTHIKTFLHAIGRRNGWYDGRNVRFCETMFILPYVWLFCYLAYMWGQWRRME